MELVSGIVHWEGCFKTQYVSKCRAALIIKFIIHLKLILKYTFSAIFNLDQNLWSEQDLFAAFAGIAETF